MARTKPCPHCERPIVETAKICCFCGHNLDAIRLAALSRTVGDDERLEVAAETKPPAVVCAFPGLPAGDQGIALGTTTLVSPSRPSPAVSTPGGEPPDRRRAVFRTGPPLRAVVFLLAVCLLLAVAPWIFPAQEDWFDWSRRILAVGGLYWLLLSPFTSRTPSLIGAMYMPLMFRFRHLAAPHSGLSPLDWVLLFLVFQAFAIASIRLARWKGRAVMAVAELDEKDEPSHSGYVR